MRFLQSNVFRWSVWWLFLAILTWALCSPDPAKAAQDLLPSEMTFTASKSVHVFSYAFMAVLVVWLPATPGQRLALWVLLALHGAVTEYIQTFVPGRFGSVGDVLIDLSGLCLGLALARYLLRRRSGTEPAAQ